jgi:hypothetical protein
MNKKELNEFEDIIRAIAEKIGENDQVEVPKEYLNIQIECKEEVNILKGCHVLKLMLDFIADDCDHVNDNIDNIGL